jgi:hypothetical protein
MTLSTVTTHSYTVLGLAPGDFATYLACGVAVVAAFVASLQATRATRQGSYATIASMLQDMNRIFMENPNLRPHFFGNPAPAAPTEADDIQKVETITFYLLNLYEAIWSFKPQMGKDERKAWHTYIKKQLEVGSILQVKYKVEPNLYPNLVKAMKP